MPGTRLRSMRAEYQRRRRLASDPDARVRVQWGRIAAAVCLLGAGWTIACLITAVIDRM